jgi:hypothetical protein
MHGNNMSVFAYHRPLFLTLGVTFWSVRLAGFLFYRVLQTQTDKCVLSLLSSVLPQVFAFLVKTVAVIGLNVCSS